MLGSRGSSQRLKTQEQKGKFHLLLTKEKVNVTAFNQAWQNLLPYSPWLGLATVQQNSVLGSVTSNPGHFENIELQ